MYNGCFESCLQDMYIDEDTVSLLYTRDRGLVIGQFNLLNALIGTINIVRHGF
jgi:hypothetical protein